MTNDGLYLTESVVLPERVILVPWDEGDVRDLRLALWGSPTATAKLVGKLREMERLLYPTLDASIE